MKKYTVGLTRYEKERESVQRVIELSNAFEKIPKNSNVFIKPNIVCWTSSVVFPKWGVVTTSRVVEDVIILLKDHGVDRITIGEGLIPYDPKDKSAHENAIDYLGYRSFEKKYGVRLIDVFKRPIEEVDLGDGIMVNINSDIMHSDFIVNLPVLKTHGQTLVSLGIKNLKGALPMESRKKCHSTDNIQDLYRMISRIPQVMPPSATVIDGIFSLEYGPILGRARRSNVLVASSDTLSADIVGTKILGYDPSSIKHIAHYADSTNRPVDMSDIHVKGERIEDLEAFHKAKVPYNDDNTLPIALENMGIRGLTIPPYDSTMCTYCSVLFAVIVTAIALAWKGEKWDEVEILTGKVMKPSPGKKKTILLGRCMYKLHKDNPQIQEMIPVKGCPAKSMQAAEALHKAGIDADPAIFENIGETPGYLMARYANNPEFDESFFKITDEVIT